MYAEALQTLFGLEVGESLDPVASFADAGPAAPDPAASGLSDGLSDGLPDGCGRGPAVIRVGTRASALARTQSQLVADALSAALGEPAELVLVATHGDRSGEPLRELARSTSGTGVFVSALRDALLAGSVDVAVHSLKDLPTAPAPGLALAAVPEREDPRDALVSADGVGLADLPDGARIGTGSPRRAAMLLVDAARRGHRVEVVDVRGNVDTRLARVGTDLDAVVLAVAGLRRLGREDEVSQVLPAEVMLPCPGQGALAVETRSDDPLTARVGHALDHAATRAAVTAERSLLRVLDVGCSAPVGAWATVVDGRLDLRAALAEADPVDLAADAVPRLLLHRTGGDPADAEAVGARAGHELLAARAPARQEHRTTTEGILR
jgi:hydroxymethylbilane synthase